MFGIWRIGRATRHAATGHATTTGHTASHGHSTRHAGQHVARMTTAERMAENIAWRNANGLR